MVQIPRLRGFGLRPHSFSAHREPRGRGHRSPLRGRSFAHPRRQGVHAGRLHARRACRAFGDAVRACQRIQSSQARPCAGRNNPRPNLPCSSRHPRQDHHIHSHRPHPYRIGRRMLRIPGRHFQELRHQPSDEPQPHRRGRGRRVRPFFPAAPSRHRSHHCHGRRPP